jgi:hypothetical protein
MTYEGRYISQAERARRLIDKAVAAWQQIQTFAMEHDGLVDSLVLGGQELWLPHHETDGRQFRATLVASLHYPEQAGAAARVTVEAFIRKLEQEFSDADGSLAVRLEPVSDSHGAE